MKTPLLLIFSALSITGCASVEINEGAFQSANEIDQAMRAVSFKHPYPNDPSYVEVSKVSDALLSTQAADSKTSNIQVLSQSLFGSFDNKIGQSSYNVSVSVQSSERISFSAAQIKTPFASYSTSVDSRALPTLCSDGEGKEKNCKYTNVVQFQASVFPYQPEAFDEINEQYLNVELVAIGYSSVALKLPVSEFKEMALANRGYLERVLFLPAVQ